MLNSDEKKILMTLCDYLLVGLSFDEIADETGISCKKLEKLLKRLESKGFVEKRYCLDGSVEYTLGNKGVEWCQEWLKQTGHNPWVMMAG